jgi:hypothetical protein
MSKYFWGTEIICEKCGILLDWWDLLLRHFDWEVPSYLYSIVGGLTTSFMIKMERNKTFLLDLESIGLPINSKIFQISYTANGSGLFPIEVHGKFMGTLHSDILFPKNLDFLECHMAKKVMKLLLPFKFVG